MKALKGTSRKDREHHIPQFEPGIPPMPEGLSDLARAEWARICPDLVEKRILTTMDRAVLTGYVTTWAEWQTMEADIAENGVSFETDSGYQQRRPAVSARDKARKACHDFAKDLGLSPTSRRRLDVPVKKTDEPNPYSLMGLAK